MGGGAESLLRHWRRLAGDARSVAVVALLSAVVAAAIVVILWTSGGRLVPLYGQNEQYDTGAVAGALQAESIAFEIDARTGTVLVHQEKLAAARMKLAAQGIAAQLPAGMESLSELSSLTTSQFMESNRYIYAVEGELARSILTLRQVSNARVHLAIPKRTLFVGREEQQPTASVVLDLTRKLEESQVEAIVNLVAASVPGMKPGAVSVVDQHGDLLSAGLGANSPERISNKQMDYVLRLEQKVAQAASEMLEPMLGVENFRVRVSAEVDFSKVEETRETLSENPVLLNETTLSDSAAGQLALGVPGALTNQPPLPDQEPAAEDAARPDSRAVNRREEVSRRFGTGREVTHTRSEEARVKQLSVSILVNDAAAADGAWSQADLDKMTEVARVAVGLNPQRGDSIIVQSAPFVARAQPLPLDTPKPYWQYLVDWRDYLRYLVGGVLVMMLIYLGMRPLVNYLTRAATGGDGEAPAPSRALGAVPSTRVDTAPGSHCEQPLPAALAVSAEGAAAPNLPPPGSELEVQLQHLRLLADQETTRAVEVIKSWINEREHKAG